MGQCGCVLLVNSVAKKKEPTPKQQQKINDDERWNHFDTIVIPF